ncbi:MAG: tetratricopeptide repeat protein [Cyclobacteriaceae bacterium]
MKKILLFSFCMIAIITAHPQESLDSISYYFSRANASQYYSFDSMFFYANRLKSFGTKNDSKLAHGKYHAVVGVALEELGNYDSALFHQNEALLIGQAINDSDLISVSYQHLGVIHKDLGNYDIAIGYLLDAARISESIGKYYTTAMAYLVTSQIQFSLGKYEQAFDYVGRCIEIGKENNDPKVIYSGTIERGNNRVMTGDLDGALNDYREAEKSLNQSGIRDGLAGLINNMGAVSFYKGDFSGAIEYYARAKREAEISVDPIMVGVAYQSIGEAYIYLKEYDESYVNLMLGLDILKKHGNKQLIVSNYQYLHDLEQARGEYKAALRFFVLKDAYEDSILNEQNLANISNLEIKYETEKKEQEIKNLQVAAELSDLELSQKRNQIIGLSILAILSILGVVLYSSRRRYKLRAQMAEENEILQKGRFKAVIDAEERERKRIARELHDGLGQLLSTARINVSGVGDKEDKKIKNSLMLIDQSIEEVRNISHNLMPNALISVGLKSALDGLIRKINDSEQLRASIQIDAELQFDETKIIGVYRVIQEVINNALKHSKSESLELYIMTTGMETEFMIADRGEGFDTSLIDNLTGIGWSNISSRVDLMNGKINIYSKLGEGTTVKIIIPNDRESDQAAAG